MGRAVVAVPLVLVPALGVVQGGYQPDAWVWSAALAAWASALALVLSADPGALRRAWPWAAASALLLGWTLLSAVWSARPGQTVLESRRTLLYVAVVLALLLLARREGARLLAPATHVAVSGFVVYALARYLLGGRHYDEFEGYLLSNPIGYANGIGVVSALGIVLGAGVAAGVAATRARAAAAATVPVLALALTLSQSTASWLALAVGLAVVALLTPATTRFLVTLAAVALPAVAAVLVGVLSRLTSTTVEPRLSGAAVGAIALGCAAIAALVVSRLPLHALPAAGHGIRRLVVAAVVVLALAGAAAAGRSGATEPRASYYHVAWHDQVTAHPFLGTGAATFGFYWARSQRQLELGGALDAHSLYLEMLAELGPVGLLLLAAMLAAPLRGALRRRHAAYVPAAVGAYATFLVHAGLDWDWELPAVVVCALCCAGAVAAAELREERPLGGRTRGALLAASLVLGGFAIAGARSHTEPAAAPETRRAPQRGALRQTRLF